MKNTKQEYLDYLEVSLANMRKQDIKLTNDWVRQFPEDPGVYIFFEKATIVYVGETKSLRGRMKNMLKTNNHTLRRKIAKYNLLNKTDIQNINLKKSKSLFLDEMINDWMVKKMKMSFIPVDLGRKELEELIIKKCSPKYNTI